MQQEEQRKEAKRKEEQAKKYVKRYQPIIECRVHDDTERIKKLQNLSGHLSMQGTFIDSISLNAQVTHARTGRIVGL